MAGEGLVAICISSFADEAEVVGASAPTGEYETEQSPGFSLFLGSFGLTPGGVGRVERAFDGGERGIREAEWR